jgi:hypothetical protein
VHLEPFEDELRIRYRIDGILQEVPVPAQIKRFQPAIVVALGDSVHDPRRAGSLDRDDAAVLGQVVARPVRKGLVLVISDLLEPWDPLASLLRQIRVRGHDLLVLQVLHGDEIDMPFTGDVRFNDLESVASVNTRPHQIRQHYTKLVAQWLERVRGDLQGMRADYALLRAGQEPDNGLLSLLASRQARRKATGAG